MHTLNISDNLLDNLKNVEGLEIDEKIFNLLKTNALMRLKECEDRIFEFESEYEMDFESFKRAWEEDKINDRYSHRVERAFMEWEGFEKERKSWLNTLREIKLKS